MNAMNQELHDGGLSLLAMQVEKKAVIDDDESLMEFSDDDNNNANNAESSGKKNVSVDSLKENVEPLIDFGEERGGKSSFLSRHGMVLDSTIQARVEHPYKGPRTVR